MRSLSRPSDRAERGRPRPQLSRDALVTAVSLPRIPNGASEQPELPGAPA